MKLLPVLFIIFSFICSAASAQTTGSPNPSFFETQTRTQPIPAKPVEEKTGPRQPHVEIWLPPEFQSSEKKWPLIVFSHGFGGCSRQSQFLTSYLADHGYIVVAPDHEDENCRQRSEGMASRLQPMKAGQMNRPEKPFRNPQSWSDKTEADRRDDVLFAVASLLDDRMYKNYVDTDHMGLVGHSLGGYTVMGIAGAWLSWKDKRFKAVVALSPYLGPFLSARTIGRIDIPIMYQGGTRDFDITPAIKKAGGAYNQTRAPKYFIELSNANHFAWTQMENDYQGIINRTVLAFFDRYLKDAKTDILPGSKDKQVTLFWADDGQGNVVPVPHKAKK